MTKEEFEAQYAKRSKMSVGKLHELGFWGAYCYCGLPDCQGWQVLNFLPGQSFPCGAHGLEERAIKRFRQWELPPDMNVDTNPTRWQVFKYTVRVRLLDWYWRRK